MVNSYAYAGNSPLKLTDPSGRSFLGDLVLGALITAAAVFTAGASAGFMIQLLGAAGTAFAPVVGAISGAIAGGIAGGIVGAVGYGVQGRSTAEGFVHGMIQGAIAGAVAGAVVGFNSLSAGKNPVEQGEESLNSSGENNRSNGQQGNGTLEARNRYDSDYNDFIQREKGNNFGPKPLNPQNAPYNPNVYDPGMSPAY